MLPIAIIDDHFQLRRMISAFLEKEPFYYQVFQYENGLDFVNRFPKQNYSPAIVLMDIRMSPMDGFETTEWLHDHYPDIPILAFTEVFARDSILRISRLGASGCIDKNFKDVTFLKAAIEKVINGERHYEDIEMLKFIKKYLSYDSKDFNGGVNSLTKMQIKVVKQSNQDKTIAEKADSLCISTCTLKKHHSNIFQKLGVKNASALRKIAFALGLIDFL